MDTTDNPIQPTWRGSLAYGWATMKKYFLPLLLIVIVLGIVDAPMEIATGFFNDDGPRFQFQGVLEITALAYWLLFVPVIEYGADLLFIQAVRGEKIKVKNIIIGFNNYINIILTNILASALIGIAMIALIIPGIIVACRLAFVSFLVMDKGLDPVAAVEGSWKLTRGFGWKIFALGVTSIFIFFGGLLLMFVGVIPAIMWIKASFASLYEAALQETDDPSLLPPSAEQLA
jgi:hypothetical protein